MHSLCAGLIALATGAASPAGPADGVPVAVKFKGAPVAGASVRAFRAWGDGPPAAAPVVTDKAGVARVPRSVFGDDGTGTAVLARAPDGRVGGAQSVRASSTPTTVELFDVAAWSGRVTGPDGKPAAGVAVVVRGFSGPPPGGRGNSAYVIAPPHDEFRRTTGADGTFAFPAVPAGGLVTLRLGRAGMADLIGSARTDRPLVVTLTTPGGVRLTFRGADAASTKGMTYAVNPPEHWPAVPAAGQPRFTASAGGTLDGTAGFTVNGLPPGDYAVGLRGGGAVPVAAAEGKLTVTVKPGATADVTVDLVKLARTTGRVVDAATGAPVAGAKVGVAPPERHFDDDSGFPYATVTADADGRYVSHAPAGAEVRAGVSVLGPRTMAAGYLNPEYDRGRLPTPSVKLTAAGHTFPDIKLRKAATFTALVVGADDKPVAADVRPARMDHGGADELVTGADGVVSIPDLDPAALIALRVRRGDAVNVPEPIEVGAPDRQTVRLSADNACVVAGRVVDTAGKPVPGASVALHWMYRGVGKYSTMSTSRTFETLTTAPDGRFRSSALWPGDEYWVVVTAKGFGTAESEHVTGAAGQTHDTGVKLVPADLAVTGRVVDLAGKPVAGVTVMQRGDGDKPTETTSGPDGAFRLAGYRTGPAFVFARHPGHRLTVAPAEPGGPAVTVTLRKTTDPHAPAPDMTAHRAALDALTRETFAALWKARGTLGGFERSIFEDFVRFDPAAAKTAADEAKRGGDQTNYAVYLARAEKDAKLLGVAKADPEEAVALLSNRTGAAGCDDVLRLARELRPIDPAKALTLAEDAVQRARSLDMPERAYYLARAGRLAAGCGNAAGGKAIVAEAADLAAKLPADHGRAGMYRGYVAADLAAFDRPRALKMLADYPDADDGNRYLAQAVDRVAVADPAAAEKMLGEFRGGRSYYQHEARMFVAYRLAATDPDAAVKLVAGITEEHYRTFGYVGLARVIARTDRPRAWKVFDKAFAEYDAVPDGFDSWSGMGGRPAVLGMAAAAARDVGYPDVAGAVARALLHRPTAREERSPEQRNQQLVTVALSLSFADPAAARRVLAAVAPGDEFAARAATGRREWLLAAAFVTPEHAMKTVTPRLAAFRNGQSGLVELFDALSAADRVRGVANWQGLPRMNSEWEE